jgi:hypothetical protein
MVPVGPPEGRRDHCPVPEIATAFDDAGADTVTRWSR